MAESASAEELAILNAGEDDKVVAPIEEKLQRVAPVIEDKPDESEDESEEIEEPEVKEEPTKEDEPLHERPTFAQMKAKYPDIIKDFPALKAIYYREQQFSDLFTTPADAKEAAENNEAFSAIRNDLFDGDGTKFLEALKESDNLGNFSKNILNSLYKVSPEAQWTALAPVFQNAIRAFYKSSGDENDQNAAMRLAQYLFGDPEVASGKKNAVKIEEPKENKEKDTWKTERYNNFRIDTLSGIHDSVKSEILSGMKEEHLSNFIKDAIADKVIDAMRDQLQSDKAHMDYMGKLWDKANNSGYTTADKSSITNAFLARAKAIVPSIRRKLIAEALGSSVKINDKKIETIERGQARREPGASGRIPMNGNKIYSPKEIDFSKTSDLDILNGNVTLKTRK
jgi:hypothetical protein